jgi:hypothetical protein
MVWLRFAGTLRAAKRTPSRKPLHAILFAGFISKLRQDKLHSSKISCKQFLVRQMLKSETLRELKTYLANTTVS